MKNCPVCNSSKLTDFKRGFICQNCGYVYDPDFKPGEKNGYNN